METLINHLQKRVENERQASCLARAERNKTDKTVIREKEKKAHLVNRLRDYVLSIDLDIADPLL